MCDGDGVCVGVCGCVSVGVFVVECVKVEKR